MESKERTIANDLRRQEPCGGMATKAAVLTLFSRDALPRDGDGCKDTALAVVVPSPGQRSRRASRGNVTHFAPMLLRSPCGAGTTAAFAPPCIENLAKMFINQFSCHPVNWRPAASKSTDAAIGCPAIPSWLSALMAVNPTILGKCVATGQMPWMKRTLANGAAIVADCVVPTFTNPNNLSIVTGAPPSVHGICGNYLYDPPVTAGRDERSEMAAGANNSRGARRSGQAGRGGDCEGQAAQTARPQDARHLLSSEKSDQVTVAENGIDNVLDLVGMPVPDVYSAALSGIRLCGRRQLMQTRRPDVM